jgi:hypothetical protein
VILVGIQIESGLNKGKKMDELLDLPLSMSPSGRYGSGAGLVKRKKKIRKDGTF